MIRRRRTRLGAVEGLWGSFWQFQRPAEDNVASFLYGQDFNVQSVFPVNSYGQIGIVPHWVSDGTRVEVNCEWKSASEAKETILEDMEATARMRTWCLGSVLIVCC